MIAISESARKWLAMVDRVHGRIKEPRRRGHPYVYSTALIIRCYFLMLLQPRLRQHAALHAFLVRHALVRALVGLDQVPHRTTFSRRFRALERGLRARIWAMGLAFVLYQQVQMDVVMADGTLHQAAGPSWPARYQREGTLPAGLRHIDRAAGWGKSAYHHWVWGYRSHVIVGLNAQLQPIPLLMAAEPNHIFEGDVLLRQLPWLPGPATALLADSNYETLALFEAWERRDECGYLTRWAVIAPSRLPGRPSAWRQQLQVRCLVEEADLYGLRYKLLEPFFAHWKQAFDLYRLPLQGQAAKVYLLLAMYAYQLLIWDNLHAGRPTYAYQHLLHGDA